MSPHSRPLVGVQSSVILVGAEKSTQKLEEQLHEQYAINNNSNASSLISILTTLTIAFSAYGYVLYQYLDCSFTRNADVLLIVTCAVVGVLLLLYIISVNLGLGQRMEQFITFAIRMDRYRKSSQMRETYYRIYPQGYNPFNKSYCQFVQGIYNILSVAIVVCLLVVVVLYFCISMKLNSTSILFCCPNVIFNILWPISLMSMMYYKLKGFCHYRKRQNEYRTKYRPLCNDYNDILYKNVFGDENLENKVDEYLQYCFPLITILLAMAMLLFTICVDKEETGCYVVMSVVIAFSTLYSILMIKNNK